MALVPFPGPQSGALQRPPEPEEDDGSGAADRMSFLEHLDELRKRIINCLLYIAAGVVVAFAFHQQLYDFILEPTRKVLPAGSRLIYTQPGEAFSLVAAADCLLENGKVPAIVAPLSTNEKCKNNCL